MLKESNFINNEVRRISIEKTERQTLKINQRGDVDDESEVLKQIQINNI